MKIFSFIILAVFFFSVSGCENVDIVETKIEYKEKIIVSSEITAGKEFAGVTISKTLPIDETYDIQKAGIADAHSYLRINFVKIVPLHYRAGGLYTPSDTLDVEAGDVYELFGEVNGKSIYAETVIPQRPAISSPVMETGYIHASIAPREGEVYAARWIIYSPGSDNEVDAAEEFSSVIGSSGLNSSGSITVRTSVIPELYLSSAYSGRLYIEVSSFDKAYQKYYNSREHQQVVNNTFIQGGESVAWNVSGEDVIGLFIGVAKSKMIAN